MSYKIRIKKSIRQFGQSNSKLIVKLSRMMFLCNTIFSGLKNASLVEMGVKAIMGPDPEVTKVHREVTLNDLDMEMDLRTYLLSFEELLVKAQMRDDDGHHSLPVWVKGNGQNVMP